MTYQSNLHILAVKHSIKLRKKERDVKAFILNQICTTGENLSEITAICAQLRDKAEEIAPKREWKERLSCEDLPTNLSETCSELKNFRSSVRLLIATRTSFERRSNIEEMKGGFESLFKALNDAVATNKKRKATEEPEDRPVARGGGQGAGCKKGGYGP